MTMRTGRLCCTLVGMALMLMGCATRQDMMDMNSRVLLLEQARTGQATMLEENRSLTTALESRVDAQEKDLRASYARIRSEMDNLRLAIQALQGGMEESRFRSRGGMEPEGGLADELARVKDALMKLSGRVQHLADYVGLETAEVAQQGRSVPEKKISGKKEEEKTAEVPVDLDALYAEGKQAYDNGAFERARDLFQEVLKRFPDSARADNAQFWIGEIYYRENWYEKAILEYQKVIDTYPKGNKVASALLKQGLAFEKLGQKANARLILEELVRKYPGSSESLIAQRKLRQL